MFERTLSLITVGQGSGYMPDAPIGMTLAVFAVIIALTIIGFIVAAKLVPRDRSNSANRHGEHER
jgi:hypothetical protein